MTGGLGMADEPRQVTIATTTTGGRITIDSADLSDHLIGYDIQHHAGQPPLMMLHIRPGAALTLTVDLPPEPDDGPRGRGGSR